jgi:hypothetical protein
MRVLVAGASGALGIPLTRLLVARGHSVVGLIRNPAGADGVRALGAEPVVADALDRDDLLRAVNGLTADAVIHELTSLRKPPLRANGMAVTNRLRTEGTANLLAVADRLGAKRMVTQSIVLGYGFRDHGDRILTEGDTFGIPAGDLTDDPSLSWHRRKCRHSRRGKGSLFGMAAVRRRRCADAHDAEETRRPGVCRRCARVGSPSRRRRGNSLGTRGRPSRPGLQRGRRSTSDLGGALHRDGGGRRRPSASPTSALADPSGRPVRGEGRHRYIHPGFEHEGQERARLAATVYNLPRRNRGNGVGLVP